MWLNDLESFLETYDEFERSIMGDLASDKSVRGLTKGGKAKPVCLFPLARMFLVSHYSLSLSHSLSLSLCVRACVRACV